MARLGRSIPIQPHIPRTPPVLGATQTLAGQSDGTSTATCAIAVNFSFGGSSAGVATTTATLKVAWVLGGSSAGVGTATCAIKDTPPYAFIASVSGTKILDQNGQPYWIQGCSPQLMAVKGLHTDFDAYFSAVAAKGYNAAQVMSITDNSNLGNVGGVNANGDAPFGNMSTFASPTTAYWNLVDDLVTTAAGYGITVFLGIADNIAYGGTIGSMSSTNATNYGTFLGNRYKTATNIVWIVGNDYLSSQWAGRDANYKHIMDAIAAAGDTHIMTAWFDSRPGTTNGTGKDNTAWDTYTSLAGTYTYDNTYTSYLASRADTTPTIPVYGQEMSYDGEKDTVAGPPSTSKHALRRFTIEAATCGARGAFFGQHNVWQFNGSQLTDAADAASTQQGVIATIVKGISGWETLTNNASLISGGAGTADNSTSADYETDTFATGAITADGLHAIILFPNARGSITLDLTQMTTGTATAHWVDPSTGSTTSEGTPAAPTMPGANADGDHDWILTVDVAASTTLAGSSSGVGSTSCAITVNHTLAGTSAGVATDSCALVLKIGIAGTSAGVATAVCAFVVAYVLAGSSDGVATTTASITLGGASVTFAGSSDGVATASCGIVLGVGLSGTSQGVSTAAGACVVAFALGGTAAGVGFAICTLSGGTSTVKFGPLLGSPEFYSKLPNESWNDAAYRYWTAFIP